MPRKKPLETMERERGKRKQQVVVGPLRRPGKNDEQHSRHRADQDKKENGDAVHPDLRWDLGAVRVERGLVLSLGRGFGQLCRALESGVGSVIRCDSERPAPRLIGTKEYGARQD